MFPVYLVIECPWCGEQMRAINCGTTICEMLVQCHCGRYVSVDVDERITITRRGMMRVDEVSGTTRWRHFALT